MKKLLIVESPAKIKTIRKFLGKDFTIMSTMGHIVDLPQKKMGVEVSDKGKIDIDYVAIPGKEKTIADLCKASRNADVILLAPDPDREGEIIAWHVAQEINKLTKKEKNIQRITFNEITKPAILKAIENPRKIHINRVNAQQARRVLDRWVGYEVSPILWRKIASGLSAGRVQSVALRLIVEREQEIRDFKPEEYWSFDGLFAKDSKTELPTELSKIGTKKIEIKNEKDAKKLVTAVKKESYIIDSITDKKRKKNPVAPFMTSTLQQAAYNKLGFSVKKTMQVAQKLYEGMPLQDKSTPVALITYMRTDSARLSDTAITAVRSFIKEQFDAKYLPKTANVYGKKSKTKTQDAHEAIRAIDVTLTPEKVKPFIPADAYKLYTLIWKRFVACQMKAAEYAQRQVLVKGGKFTFSVTGSTLTFDGFLKVYKVDDDKDDKKVTIPASIKEKDPVDLKKLDPKQHFTQPPPRFTEASLVKTLEKEGIGRPSTYVSILNTIRARSYTTLDERKRFVPTDLGSTVVEMLVKNLPKIMDPKFTANMEDDLDKIEQGDIKRDKLLYDFHQTFQKDLKVFAEKDGKGRATKPTGVKCPTCKKDELLIRFGKAGEFVGCAGYPDCDFTSNFTRNEDGSLTLVETKPPELLDELCPKCNSQMRNLMGKYGEFTACSGYPKCKYIKQNKSGYDCPSCKKGELIERVWRGGKFWGCSDYPKCKFNVFDQIKKTPCKKCDYPFTVEKIKKDGSTVSCANKDCTDFVKFVPKKRTKK